VYINKSIPPVVTTPSYIINIYMCISNYARILIVQYGAKNPPKKFNMAVIASLITQVCLK
jgi:hypothetical protein